MKGNIVNLISSTKWQSPKRMFNTTRIKLKEIFRKFCFEEKIKPGGRGTMTYNPDIHHRRSIRLRGYDYSRAGAYFVTICTQNRECLFGEIKNGEMVLNGAGRMVQIVWDEMRGNYPGVETDDFIVMPNHIHGIIVLVGAGPCACPDTGQPQNDGQPQGVAPTAMEQRVAGQPQNDGQPQGVAPAAIEQRVTGQPQGGAPPL